MLEHYPHQEKSLSQTQPVVSVKQEKSSEHTPTTSLALTDGFQTYGSSFYPLNPYNIPVTPAAIVVKAKEFIDSHRIATQIFAKNVIETSSGYFNFIVKKPKTWWNANKTEIEAYRKLYAFLSDENAMNSLAIVYGKANHHPTTNTKTSPAARSLKKKFEKSEKKERKTSEVPFDTILVMRRFRALMKKYRIHYKIFAEKVLNRNKDHIRNLFTIKSNSNWAWNRTAKSTQESIRRIDEWTRKKPLGVIRELVRLSRLAQYQKINNNYDNISRKKHEEVDGDDDKDKDDDEILNTADVANKVNSICTKYCIMKKYLAEYVVKCERSNISKILNQPKRWSSLDKRGREAYNLVYRWSNNADAIAKLKQLSDESLRRKRHSSTASNDIKDSESIFPNGHRNENVNFFNTFF